MRKALLAIMSVALLCFFTANADAAYNYNGKFALHFAGVHDAKVNTCELVITDCTGLVVDAPAGPGRFDVYVLALDVTGVASLRYGIYCDGLFFFYGWTTCADLEIPETGWPGCGLGNAEAWSLEQAGPHVTLGILDVYVYGPNEKLRTGVDPRVGYADMCDGSPTPLCNKITDARAFGRVGFGAFGYNPCGQVATEQSSWGAVKSLYR